MCMGTLKGEEDAGTISLVLALPEAYLCDPVHDGFQQLPSPSKTAIGVTLQTKRT